MACMGFVCGSFDVSPYQGKELSELYESMHPMCLRHRDLTGHFKGDKTLSVGR